MRKSLSVLIAGVLLMTCAGFASAEDAAYVASKGGEKYHAATCSVAKKISKDNLVSFAKPEDAIKAGYKPCKTCNPPPSADALVASTGGGKYHKPSCAYAGKISTENKAYFKDASAAEKAGYTPCGICFKK